MRIRALTVVLLSLALVMSGTTSLAFSARVPLSVAAVGSTGQRCAASPIVYAAPGDTLVFNDCYLNVGITSWAKGAATQVSLDLCCPPYADPTAPHPWAVGWPAPKVMAIQLEAVVSAGQLAHFLYSVHVPPGTPPGLYVLEGYLADNTGTDIGDLHTNDQVVIPHLGVSATPAVLIALGPGGGVTSTVHVCVLDHTNTPIGVSDQIRLEYSGVSTVVHGPPPATTWLGSPTPFPARLRNAVNGCSDFFVESRAAEIVGTDTYTATDMTRAIPAVPVQVSTGIELAVTKADSPDPVVAGGLLTYTITVTDVGPIDATNVKVIDTLPPGITVANALTAQGACAALAGGTITCTLGVLPSGSSWIITIDARAPSSAGTITNSATISSDARDAYPATDTATASTTVLPPPDLVLTKADSPDPVAPGAPITYTIVVTNSGTSAATGVVVTDVLPAGAMFLGSALTPPCTNAAGVVTCTLGSIAAGASVTATISVAPTGVGTLTNCATVAGNEADANPADNTACAMTSVESADVALTKTSSPATAAPGQAVTYMIVATNNGPSTATGVVVTDALPAGLSGVSASSTQGTCAVTSGSVTCAIGTFASGATATITISATMPSTIGTITDQASVTADQADPNTANNSASASTAVASADLSVTKTATPGPALAGGSVTYTVTVTNNGPSDATNVLLIDSLPSGTTLSGVSGGPCSWPAAATAVTCAFATLAGGASETVAITVQTTASGTIVNQASVTGTEFDPVTANNTASATTTVLSAADLWLTKTDSVDPVLAGTQFYYTIKVHNDGPSSATNVILTDTLPAGLTYVGGNLAGTACTSAPAAGGGTTVTCGLATVAAGTIADAIIGVTANAAPALSVTNTATVTASEADPTPTNNTVSESTGIRPVADLAVTKTASPSPAVAPGNVTFTITVTNNGPYDATNVVAYDTLPAGASFVSITSSQGPTLPGGQHFCGIETAGPFTGQYGCRLGTIAVGANATMTFVVSIIGTANPLSDTATAIAAEIDPNSANDSATLLTPVLLPADLAIMKADSPDPVGPSHPLSYTITVINAGPGPATNVTVVDTLPAGVSGVTVTPAQGTCGLAGSIVTCVLGTMAPNSTAMVTIDVTAPPTTGSILNQATVSATETDPNTVNNTAWATTTVASADLEVTKTGTPDPVLVNGNVTYTITVVNHGPSVATGVTLVDMPVAGLVVPTTPAGCSAIGGTVTCALGSLASGAATTVTVVVKPTVSGIITDQAHVTANEFDPNAANNTATASTTVEPGADLSITKVDLTDPVVAGAAYLYRIDVRNSGPADATNVVVTDPLPAGLTFLGSSVFSTGATGPAWTPCTGVQANGTWTLTCALAAPLRVAETATVFVVVSAGNVSPTNRVTNTAAVRADQLDPDQANNSASETTTILPMADLAVTKTAPPGPAIGYRDLTYTITVTNNGPYPATNVVALDTLPTGTTFVSIRGSQGPLGGTFCETPVASGPYAGQYGCNLGTIAVGGSATMTFVVNVGGAAGPLSDTARAVANEIDAVNANDIAVLQTVVVQQADLSVAKTCAPNPVGVGQDVVCTISFSDLGPGPATGVTIVDTLPAGAAFKPAGSSSICTAQATIVTCAVGQLSAGVPGTATIVFTAPSTPGAVINGVTISGNETDPIWTNNGAGASVVVAEPDLAVTKTAPGRVAPGGQVTYTLQAKNVGTVDATGVTVTDALPLNLTFFSVSPTPACAQAGGVVTCTFGTLAAGASAPAVTIVAIAPSATGNTSNTATVSSTEPDANPADNSATAVTTIASTIPGKIIFLLGHANGSMSTIDPDGTNLTPVPLAGEAPRWSPTADRIAYFADAGGNREVWVANADGTGRTQLTSLPGLDQDPSWSADGAKIAFMHQDPFTFSEDIWVLDSTTGAGLTNLTNEVYPALAQTPAWSRDGTKIAYVSSMGTGRFQVFVMNADGTGQTRIVTDGVVDDWPAWSPDGTKIAYARCVYVSGRSCDIYVTNADGTGTPVQLTTDPADDIWPTWSPDGTKIAFMSDRGGSNGVYTMDANGANQTLLSIGGEPDWSRSVNKSVAANVAAGGSLSTGTTATPSDQLQVRVTSPNAGNVTIAVQPAPSSGAPAGYTFLGLQAQITAPPATAGSPLVFVFTIDASLIPPGGASTIQVQRNGVAVVACAGSTGASPDPCFTMATLPGGDVQITVRTSQASVWRFAVRKNAPPSCVAATVTPSTLWPPDGAFRLVTITGVSDRDGDRVTVHIDRVTQDEPVFGGRFGNTSPDAKRATRADQLWLRAERAATGDGRVYRVAFTATDGRGGSCSGVVTVGVPRDRDKAAVFTPGVNADSFAVRPGENGGNDDHQAEGRDRQGDGRN